MYTRAYSKNSSGQLVAAKKPRGPPLSRVALLEEFTEHKNRRNQKPTALVSASDRVIDTIKRAFDKCVRGKEPPAEIWIAFIEAPTATNYATTRVHRARDLAEALKLEESVLFSHEVVFEWAIPEQSVSHTVSLQTLLKRGLTVDHFSQASTAEVRKSVAAYIRNHHPWEQGLILGKFAKAFGARAPLDWISRQLFHDCVWSDSGCDYEVVLKHAHGPSDLVDLRYFCDMEDGINACLYEWWLSDLDFVQALNEFNEHRDCIEDGITMEEGEFWMFWHNVNADGTSKAMRYSSAFNQAQDELLTKHQKQRARVEAAAVSIGL